jgi:hypothetical protein
MPIQRDPWQFQLPRNPVHDDNNNRGVVTAVRLKSPRSKHSPEHPTFAPKISTQLKLQPRVLSRLGAETALRRHARSSALPIPALCLAAIVNSGLQLVGTFWLLGGGSWDSALWVQVARSAQQGLGNSHSKRVCVGTYLHIRQVHCMCSIAPSVYARRGGACSHSRYFPLVGAEYVRFYFYFIFIFFIFFIFFLRWDRSMGSTKLRRPCMSHCHSVEYQRNWISWSSILEAT